MKQNFFFTAIVLASLNLQANEQLEDRLEKINKYLEKDPSNAELLKEKQSLLSETPVTKKKKSSNKKINSQNSNDQLEARIWRLEKKIQEQNAPVRNISSVNEVSTTSSSLTPTISGLIDIYYLHNFNNNDSGGSISNRYYDNKNNDFTLSLAELTLKGSNDKLSYVIDLDFGTFADLNKAHSDDAITHNIGQANFTYQISDAFSFTAGKMYTHVGYELAKAIDNANYSRAYTFGSGGPFWHEGVALKYAHDSGLSLGLYVYDRWDDRNENNGSKTYGAQVGYSSGNFSVFYNFITGGERENTSAKKTLHEANASYKWNESFLTAIDAASGYEDFDGAEKKRWTSVALYSTYNFSSGFSLSPRLEYFLDNSTSPSVSIFSPKASISAGTLTGKITLTENLQWRNEVRYETSGKSHLYTKNNIQNVHTQTTLSSAFILNF